MDAIKNYNTMAKVSVTLNPVVDRNKYGGGSANTKTALKDADEFKREYVKKQPLNINNDEDIPAIKTALKNYVKIEDRHIGKIPVGCYVRYIDRETGVLMRGNTVFKQYDALDTHNYQFILLGTYFRNRFYKLRKDRYIFFVKDTTVKEQIAQEKEHLYKLYKQGLLQLVEEEDALNSDITTYCDEYYCDE